MKVCHSTMQALYYVQQNLLDTAIVARDMQLILQSEASTVPSPIVSPLVEDRQCAGRPRVVLNLDQIELLRSAGYTWSEIATCLQVSRSTLWRYIRLNSTGMPRYSNVSDQELQEVVSQIQHFNPCTGRSITQGYLLSLGIRVPRWRIDQALRQINPTCSAIRWHQVVSRRSYNVPGPNSLWHIDANLRLIRWKFVIQGGIDGYSWYVHCLFAVCN